MFYVGLFYGDTNDEVVYYNDADFNDDMAGDDDNLTPYNGQWEAWLSIIKEG